MTVQEEFASPGGGGGLMDYNQLLGSLLVFQVVELIPHIPTVNTKPGETSPAIRADVYVLDGSQAGAEYIDSLKGVRKGEATSVAIMLLPAGRLAINGDATHS